MAELKKLEQFCRLFDEVKQNIYEYLNELKVSLIYEGLLRIRNKSSNRSKTAKSQFLSIISNVRNRTKGDKSQLSAKSQIMCERKNFTLFYCEQTK